MKYIIFIILLLAIFPIYYLSDNVVYINNYLWLIFFISIGLFILIILLNKKLKLILFEEIQITKREKKLDSIQIFFIKIKFYFFKLRFFLAIILMLYYLLYSIFNFLVFVNSINKDIKNEVIKINELVLTRNNTKYEFYFKNSIVSLHTKMNMNNRKIMQDKNLFRNYRIEIKYKNSFKGSYFIYSKRLIMLPTRDNISIKSIK